MGLLSKATLIIFFIFFIFAVYNSTSFFQQLAGKRVQAYQKSQIFDKLLKDEEFEIIKETKYALLYGSYYNNYTDSIGRIIDSYFPLLIADFNYTPEKKLHVFIHDSAVQMKDALNITNGNAPIGVFYAGSLHILNPARWVKSSDELTIKNEFLKNGPIVHELTHYLIDEKSKGNYPVWFTEGVALYYEKKYLNFEWYKPLKLQSGQITYEQLKDFYSIDEKTAYRRSYDIICFLVENFTEEMLQKLIETLSEYDDFEEAFYRIYNFSPRHL